MSDEEAPPYKWVKLKNGDQTVTVALELGENGVLEASVINPNGQIGRTGVLSVRITDSKWVHPADGRIGKINVDWTDENIKG